MGIDIYMRWNGMTKAQEKKQYTGFSVDAGHVGYLREAYHGGPYATKVLVPEAFAAEDATAKIPAATLRERLDETLTVAKERELKVYRNPEPWRSPAIKSFEKFVALAEKKEKETGEPVTIIASY